MIYFLVKFIDILFNLLYFALFARVVLSWFPTAKGAIKIRMLINDITDPILKPIKRVVPPMGMMDFSPMIAFFLLEFIKSILFLFLT